ncbi:MAG: UDP-3-O-(3-hydroxymyristoyl)glucosamine N-acyltransferase [Cyclobacteriaceae bacterium]
MQFTVRQIADLLKAEVIGDETTQISSLAELQNAGSGDISFFSNKKYESLLYASQASAILVPKDFEPAQEITGSLLKVDDSYSAFAQLLVVAENHLMPKKTGIENPSYIAESASIGEDCYIGAFAYIGENVVIGEGTQIYPNVHVGDRVKIGENCILYPGAQVMYNCVLEDHVTLHSGAIIGADGFGFAPQKDGSYFRIPQIGNVVLEDYVSVGANATIDRATVSSTIIRRGVKLDNLVHIAHNCEVGENTVMAAHVGIAGSVKIGKNCMFGGQAGLSGHITIADNNQIGPRSALMSDVTTEKNTFLGAPGIDSKEFFRIYASTKKLPDLLKRVQQLEKQFADSKK